MRGIGSVPRRGCGKVCDAYTSSVYDGLGFINDTSWVMRLSRSFRRSCSLFCFSNVLILSFFDSLFPFSARILQKRNLAQYVLGTEVE